VSLLGGVAGNSTTASAGGAAGHYARWLGARRSLDVRRPSQIRWLPTLLRCIRMRDHCGL